MFRQAIRHILGAIFVGLLPIVFIFQPARAAGLEALPGDPAIIHLLPAEQALFELTNADRVANGLEPLEFDPEALAIARSRATSQLTAPSLTHYDANGELAFVGLLAEAELSYELAGENLARASASDAKVTEHVQQALMKSPSHRKNILDGGFRRVAIGAATGQSGQITFAEVYRN